MAHQQQELLETLLELLDHERIEIFLHADKKWRDFDETSARSRLKKSKLTVLSERLDVQWGADSQIWCELALLRAAVSAGTHDYYHLISGADLPLKPPAEILAFFDAHAGKEFLQFDLPEKMPSYVSRFRYFHLFQSRFGWKLSRRKNPVAACANFAALAVQKILGSDRTRREKRIFAKGAQWFSITQALSEYVLSEETWIRRTFRATFCCDEIFLHTLVANSPFRDALFRTEFDNSQESYMRLIDWKRGGPYTFRVSDFDELANSPMLFARKFSTDVDSKIIQMLRERGVFNQGKIRENS